MNLRPKHTVLEYLFFIQAWLLVFKIFNISFIALWSWPVILLPLWLGLFLVAIALILDKVYDY